MEFDRGTEEILIGNYWHLFDTYRRGHFEMAIDSNKFKFYLRANERKAEQSRHPTIKPAADDLLALVSFLREHIESKAGLWPTKKREFLAEYELRIKVLSYEIDDYFLVVSPEKSEQFICLAEDSSNDLLKFFEQHYGFVNDQNVRGKIIQYLILSALCGINEIYRRHNQGSYWKGIRLGRKLLDYLLNDTPPAPSSRKGLLGLCYYILGRLHLALSEYEDADGYFRQSVDAYSERIHLKQARKQILLKPDHQDQNAAEELEISRLVTLRRCALASAFGNAYLALVKGQVREALKLASLARGILKQDCGEVYAAYVDLIYWTAKRAEASSDSKSLRKFAQGFYRCRSIFKRYVPETHYIHRAGIQLGIVYHYLALAEPKKQKCYYNRARRYLEQAVAFAGPNEKPRNHIMLAEALSILSHIMSRAEENEFGMAIESATLAAKIAIGIPQLECQANLTLGAIYHLKAKRISAAERSKIIQKARFHVFRALEINRGSNARIRAASYLRLAALSLLEETSYNPDAFSYYKQYLKIKDAVEHEYLQKWGERIAGEIKRLDEYLHIDESISLDPKYWGSRVEKHLMVSAVRKLAQKLKEEGIYLYPQMAGQHRSSEKVSGQPDSASLTKPGQSAIAEPKMKNRRHPEMRYIIQMLRFEFQIEKTQARNKIAEYNLREKFWEHYL